MFRVLGYIDNVKVISANMEHLPRVGDVVDVDGNKCGIVTSITWFIKTESPEVEITKQRIYIQMKSIPEKQGETK